MTQLSSDTAPTATSPVQSSLCEYAAALLAARLEKMLAQAEGVRSSQGIEPIHQMRVWSRRSRAALDVFRACFDGKEFRAIEAEVKNVTRALGAARDLDVMIENLSRREEKLPPEQQAGIESFVAMLRRERRGTQRVVEKAMNSLERFYLRDRFAVLVARRRRADFCPKRSAKKKSEALLDPQEPLFVNAERVIAARLDALLVYETHLYDPDEVYELHQMRIAAKRLRYTLEMFEESIAKETPFGKEFSAVIETVRALQEHLGEIHDADVLVPRLLTHLNRLIAEGYGEQKNGEPIAGVHRVDFDACQGLLFLCRETRDARDQRYRRLLRDWERIQEAGTFDRLRALLREAALLATQAALQDTPVVTDIEPLPTSTGETQHGEDNHQTAENLPSTPRRRSRRRDAAAPLGHSGTGSDSGEGASEGGL